MPLTDIVFRSRSIQPNAAHMRSHERLRPHGWLLLGLVAIAASASAQESSRVDQLFERLDRNGDRVIDEQELAAARRAAFHEADANRDDYVDRDELAELGDELQVAGRGPRSAFVRKRLEQRQGSMAGADRLQRMDTNRDGRLSEAEFLAAPSALLRFDRDGDGRITRAELDAAQGQARSAMRNRRRL